ncbi:Uncharacterised protein [Mycobacteroides abscessus subsp. abscessus]|nr:Uncharacterised protein [Mycobacteroides abscessus subsp. abscessus]SKV24776.1 Uncharacterised protein [Mycobacteroides abscessus subsp. abscessus]
MTAAAPIIDASNSTIAKILPSNGCTCPSHSAMRPASPLSPHLSGPELPVARAA